MSRTLRRAIPKSAPGMLFRERRRWRGTTRNTGEPPAASHIVLITDRNTGSSQSSRDLTKCRTVRRGETREGGATEAHQFTLQTMNLLIMAMFSPPDLLPVLIRCPWTITDPQRKIMSPLLHTRSLEKATVMPFRTGWGSVRNDTSRNPQGKGL